MLMPNALELAQLVGTPVDGDCWLNDSARQVIDNLALEALVVTRGGEGMSLFDKGENGLCRVDVPTTVRSVYDVTVAEILRLWLSLQRSRRDLVSRLPCG